MSIENILKAALRNKVIEPAGFMEEKQRETPRPRPSFFEPLPVLKKTPSSSSLLSEFRKSGISVLEKLNESELAGMIQTANDEYYNSKTALLSDAEFDILYDYTKAKYPANSIFKSVGAVIKDGNKVKLPFEMASMDKIKPDTGALLSWKSRFKGPYVLSCKLDGVSGLYHIAGNGSRHLYTRGDGHYGQDVSRLIGVVQGIPDGETPFIAVRGEFILPKAVFAAKYQATFANARNLVSGIVNSKKNDAKTQDLHFVAYEVVNPPMKPSEQMDLLRSLGFEVVREIETKAKELTNESLSTLLVDWRTSYEYEIDGIIVADDAVHPKASGNPEHAFAFKMVLSDQKAEAKVVDVIWAASKDGFLKPRVRIEPVHIGGVTIEYVTGYNGKFIEENRIGVGAVIQLIRSGDVIPKIVGMTMPAEKPKMPDVPYLWSENHVDLLLEDASDNEEVLTKNIVGFFVNMGVEGLAAGNVKKIMAAGFRSVKSILRMKPEDFIKVEGFQEKTAAKLHKAIHEKVNGASIIDWMVASNKMGRGLGSRKLRPILAAYPDILVSPLSQGEKIAMLQKVEGIGAIQAKTFVDNIPGFLAFLEESGYQGQKPGSAITGPIASTGDPLFGKKVAMTGFRDEAIKEALKKRGATLEDRVSSDTLALLVKSKEAKQDPSNKVKEAMKKGVPILTAAEFVQAYLS